MKRPLRKSAAAIAYDPQSPDDAPRVVAKGYGVVADMIIERAQEAGLYVHRSPEMVSLLMQVDLDARVPPQLYQAVAELLAWLYGLESGATDAPAPPEPVQTEAPARSSTSASASASPSASASAPAGAVGPGQPMLGGS